MKARDREFESRSGQFSFFFPFKLAVYLDCLHSPCFDSRTCTLCNYQQYYEYEKPASSHASFMPASLPRRGHPSTSPHLLFTNMHTYMYTFPSIPSGAGFNYGNNHRDSLPGLLRQLPCIKVHIMYMWYTCTYVQYVMLVMVYYATHILYKYSLPLPHTQCQLSYLCTHTHTHPSPPSHTHPSTTEFQWITYPDSVKLSTWTRWTLPASLPTYNHSDPYVHDMVVGLGIKIIKLQLMYVCVLQCDGHIWRMQVLFRL